MTKEKKYCNNNLRKYRKLMGYTLRDVAWLLGFQSPSRVSLWEKGRTYPGIENLIKMGLIYHTLVDQLYGPYRDEVRTFLLQRERELQAIKKLKPHVEMV